MEFCDLTTGQCGPSDLPDEEVIVVAAKPQVQVLFITDPVCSHCWGLEPVWRKLLYLYRSFISFRYIYGGLLPSWDNFSRGGITSPADLVPHFAEVAEQYDQPIDSSIWVKDPPYSSYPASIATHLVRSIDASKEEAYLRRIRQILFLESRNIARTEVLAEAAGDIGLNEAQFLELYQQGRGKIAFQQDLQEAYQLRVAGFPTILFYDRDKRAIAVRGGQPFSVLQRVFLQGSGLEPVREKPAVRDVLRAYGSGTTREFAEVLDLDRSKTIQTLRAAGAHEKALAGDILWSSAP